MNKILLIFSLIAIIISTLYMLYSTVRYYMDKIDN